MEFGEMKRNTSNWNNFLNAFASRGFVSVSWAFLWRVRRRCADCMCNGWLAFALTKAFAFRLTLGCDCARLYQACGSLIWLMCSERPSKTLPLLRVRPTYSRPPGFRTRLRGPLSICDRAASFWLLSASMVLLLTAGLRSFSIVKGATTATPGKQETDRSSTSLASRQVKTSCSSQYEFFNNKSVMTSSDYIFINFQQLPNVQQTMKQFKQYGVRQSDRSTMTSVEQCQTHFSTFTTSSNMTSYTLS